MDADTADVDWRIGLIVSDRADRKRHNNFLVSLRQLCHLAGHFRLTLRGYTRRGVAAKPECRFMSKL
jgi:hypothetical protein